MGADLFDSNIAAIAATLVIALPLGEINMLFAFCSIGLFASIIGVLLSHIGKKGNPSHALNNGTYLTCILFTVLTLIATLLCNFNIRIWLASIIGMLIGIIIGLTSNYFTGDDKMPVIRVAKSSQKGLLLLFYLDFHMDF